MKWSRLKEIIVRLRSPQGCPWDREQTHESLKRYALEETYELLEAIDQDNPEAIKDELGDLLLQVMLHAQIGAEQDLFDIDAVLENLSEKLVRRHPHVFARETATTPRQVEVKWDAIKKTERAGADRTSVLDGIPQVFPALMRAEKIQKKASKVGFDWEKTEQVVAKVEEELGELKEALASGSPDEIKEELGDLLFASVNLARFGGVDPELALQDATVKFTKRFHYLEDFARANNLVLDKMTLAEMDAIWHKAKDHLRKNPQL